MCKRLDSVGIGQNSSNDLMYRLQTLAEHGQAGPLTVYQGLRTWAEKREFADKYSLDPSCGFVTSYEDRSLTNTEVQQ